MVNSAIRHGMEISVVAAPGPDPWRTDEGLRVLGPRYFGFEFEYEPVERLWRVQG